MKNYLILSDLLHYIFFYRLYKQQDAVNGNQLYPSEIYPDFESRNSG